MRVVITGRPVAAAALIAALAAAAGCDNGGSLAAAVKPSPSAKPSAVAAATRAPQTPPALLRSTIAAMLAKGSVHLDCTEYASDDVTESLDLGVDSGIAVSGTATHGSVKVLLVGGVFYLTASAESVLVSYGFPAAVAAKYAGRSLSFQPGDSYGRISYPSTVSEVTIEAEAEQLELTGQLKSVGPVPTSGQMTVGVSGGMAASYGTAAKGSQETIFVRNSGEPLPVSTSQRISGVLETCDFSRWGEPLHLTAPHAVPVTSLPKDSTT